MIINSRWDCPRCYTRLPKKEYENTPERFCPKCGKDINPPVRLDSGPRGSDPSIVVPVITAVILVLVSLFLIFDLDEFFREFEFKDLKPIWQSGFIQFLAHIFLWPFLINSDIWVNEQFYLGKGDANIGLEEPHLWAFIWRFLLTALNNILITTGITAFWKNTVGSKKTSVVN